MWVSGWHGIYNGVLWVMVVVVIWARWGLQHPKTWWVHTEVYHSFTTTHTTHVTPLLPPSMELMAVLSPQHTLLYIMQSACIINISHSYVFFHSLSLSLLSFALPKEIHNYIHSSNKEASTECHPQDTRHVVLRLGWVAPWRGWPSWCWGISLQSYFFTYDHLNSWERKEIKTKLMDKCVWEFIMANKTRQISMK